MRASNATELNRTQPVEPPVTPRRWRREVYSQDRAGGTAHEKATQRPILIVEDEYLIASQMESELLQAGFAVAGIASSADEALALAAAHKPALAIMDIRLKGRRDGVDAALALFADYGVRCVFVSAHSDADAKERARPAKPLAWLPKPYAMPRLVEIIRAALRGL
jgi:DNA-binding NarL/FixJ family response regulator